MPNYPRIKWGRWLTAAIDAVAVIVATLAAYLIRFYLLPARHGVPELTNYIQSLLVIVPVVLFMLRSYRLYDRHRSLRRAETIFAIIKAVSVAMLILMAVTFFYREVAYSRFFLPVLWFTCCLFLSLGRYLGYEIEYQRRRARKELTRVLFVGYNRNTRQLVEWFAQHPHFGYSPLGVLNRETDQVGKHLEQVAILGTVPMWRTFVQELKPDLVILLDADLPRKEISEMVLLCEDLLIDFKMAADFFGIVTQNLGLEYMSDVGLLGLKSLPLDDLLNRAVKRTFDFVVTLILLTLTLPVWILIVLAIKIGGGKGPIFFAQERMGRDGSTFSVLKFRTMKLDAEKETGPVWAKENDSRRTAVGEFLRRWNLDELPQFLNVLRGDMSLVGPRPERPFFVDQFRENIPRYMARHRIKCGITGWAQVHGLRGNTSIEERIKYDLYYMENWSLLLDVEIIFMTLFAFRNAY
ncbi:MAG TPA: undecaprenyl-phosphate glucose phosphotransferase [Candidatus Omnitrophota bacterium]|nr:undecaprenyl-phosphate glucose phosphotransferase [Candidatus Omnitrophota bacterium]HRK61565.1 undecaprenyl-phosphate glucose phosphotransferase [Candidatus Omnitrophota bacterium]